MDSTMDNIDMITGSIEKSITFEIIQCISNTPITNNNPDIKKSIYNLYLHIYINKIVYYINVFIDRKNLI